jgi:hypothetical protein
LRRRWESAPLPKGNASAGLARAKGSRLGADVFGPEIAHEFVDAGCIEISAKYHSDPFGLVLDDGELAVLQLIAEGEGASHPQSFTLGGSNLVPDTLGSDLPLELGKGQQHGYYFGAMVLVCMVAA